ncbi:MarR family winged helix-turn-helix transcriptional regulator [Tsuneonella sp. HG094]
MTNEASTLAIGNVLTDDDRAIFLMDEISRAARKGFDERAQPLGLNRTQWRLLAQLIKDPALNQADIAKRLELESATIGLAVSTLTEQGYIERRRDPADGRAWQLVLTTKVEGILPDLRRAADLTHARLWAGIPPQQKQELLALLERVSANVRENTP